MNCTEIYQLLILIETILAMLLVTMIKGWFKIATLQFL